MNQRSQNIITAKAPWDTTIGIASLSSSRRVVIDRIFIALHPALHYCAEAERKKVQGLTTIRGVRAGIRVVSS